MFVHVLRHKHDKHYNHGWRRNSAHAEAWTGKDLSRRPHSSTVSYYVGDPLVIDLDRPGAEGAKRGRRRQRGTEPDSPIIPTGIRALRIAG